jgi:uncharacterized OB-fold protein
VNNLPPCPNREFFAFLAEGKFMIQRSRSTSEYVFYPRVATPGTGAMNLEWVQPSGFGTIYSFTLIRAKPPALDYNLALIDLDEGPRMMSCVADMPLTSIRIGQRVIARIDPSENGPMLVFVLAPLA